MSSITRALIPFIPAKAALRSHNVKAARSSNAATDGAFLKGMAVFTIAKGGLMYAATISGQQFTYTPRGGD